MSTRSLTIIRNETEEIAVMYRHMDGYPAGHGAELKAFCKGYQVTNGISDKNQEKSANGAYCLAAQLIAFFKNQWPLGNIYLYPAGTRDLGEDWLYTVTATVGQPVTINVSDA